MFEYARLSNLILPKTVTTIRDYAFAGSSVTTLNIPDSVTNLEPMALAAMYYLSEFTGELASASKRELIKDNTLVAVAAAGLSDEYTVPQNITVIRDGVFAHFTQWCKLTSIVIPEGVTTIGIGAFWGSTVLKNITIPGSVKTIGYSAFGLCESLTSLVIPEGVTNIEQQTFTGCKGLTSFTIPNGVTNIGDNAFDGCSSLSTISIPASVKSISNSAFGNSAITKVYIQDLSAFCEYETDIWKYHYSSDEGKNCLYVNGNLVTNLVIPNNVTKIGSNAFAFCSDIKSVTISSKVENIGSGSFKGCTGIKSVTIPNYVTSIDASAFYDCENLEELVLGSDIKSIGNYCFYGCDKLDEIKCHAINPPTVGTKAFGEYGMDKCYVPKNCVQIYEDAGWHSYFWEIIEMN